MATMVQTPPPHPPIPPVAHYGIDSLISTSLALSPRGRLDLASKTSSNSSSHHLTHHTHRIAHPADLAFVGKTGALADWWSAMIRHVLVGHHKRILVAPPDQIAHVAWDDIQPSNI
jgi:hypothetical protein